MSFKFFPNVQFFDFDHSKPEDEVGDVGKEIKDLSKHRPDLYLRVKSFLKVLSSAVDLMLTTAFAKMKQYKELVKQGVMR